MAIEVEDKLPKVTKDGVTIVKNVSRQDALEEICCAILRQSAHNTNEYCGDGTTTSTVVACSIFKRGQKLLASGGNPIRIKKGLELARDHAIEFLEEIRLRANSFEVLKQCALVATNYDEPLSDIIAEALSKKGLKGVIHMEPVPLPQSSLSVASPHQTIQGGGLGRGVRSPDLLKDRPNRTYACVTQTRVQVAEGAGARPRDRHSEGNQQDPRPARETQSSHRHLLQVDERRAYR